VEDNTQKLIQLQCLARIKKLKTKLETDDEIKAGKLLEISVALTLMLHDLGVDYYIREDFEISDRLDRSLAKKAKAAGTLA